MNLCCSSFLKVCRATHHRDFPNSSVNIAVSRMNCANRANCSLGEFKHLKHPPNIETFSFCTSRIFEFRSPLSYLQRAVLSGDHLHSNMHHTQCFACQLASEQVLSLLLIIKRHQSLLCLQATIFTATGSVTSQCHCSSIKLLRSFHQSDRHLQ